MGKNWKGGKGSKGASGNDFASCRGYPVVVGTCDAAREREASKELVNMLSEAIESMYPPSDNRKDSDDENESEEKFESIQDMLNNELKELRQNKNEYTQSTLSIQTGIKGIVLVKICRKDLCPVALVKSIFDKVKEDRLPCSRYVVRVLPMKLACFPNEDELNDSLRLVINASISLDESGKAVFNEYVHTGMFKLAQHKKKAVVTEETLESTSAEQIKETGADNVGENSAESDEPLSKKSRIEIEESKVVDIKEDVKAVPTESSNDNIAAAAVSVEKAEPVVAVVDSAAPVSAPDSTTSNSNTPYVPKQIAYNLSFKARNHNVLDKTMLFRAALKHMPPYARNDYRKPDLHIIVEAIKNLCAVSIVKDFEAYMEFHLRKFQIHHCAEMETQQQTTSSGSGSGSGETKQEKQQAGNDSEDL